MWGPLLGAAAGAGLLWWVTRERPAPAVTDADQERLRREAEARADAIDQGQIRDQLRAEQQRRAEEEARRARDLAALGQPAYEVVRLEDGRLAFWHEGKRFIITPGARMMGPTGRWGRFDAEGRFYPEEQRG